MPVDTAPVDVSVAIPAVDSPPVNTPPVYSSANVDPFLPLQPLIKRLLLSENQSPATLSTPSWFLSSISLLSPSSLQRLATELRQQQLLTLPISSDTPSLTDNIYRLCKIIYTLLSPSSPSLLRQQASETLPLLTYCYSVSYVQQSSNAFNVSLKISNLSLYNSFSVLETLFLLIYQSSSTSVKSEPSSSFTSLSEILSTSVDPSLVLSVASTLERLVGDSQMKIDSQCLAHHNNLQNDPFSSLVIHHPSSIHHFHALLLSSINLFHSTLSTHTMETLIEYMSIWAKLILAGTPTIADDGVSVQSYVVHHSGITWPCMGGTSVERCRIPLSSTVLLAVAMTVRDIFTQCCMRHMEPNEKNSISYLKQCCLSTIQLIHHEAEVLLSSDLMLQTLSILKYFEDV